VALASAVSVLVMDCTMTGWSEPTGTLPIQVVTVLRRGGVMLQFYSRKIQDKEHKEHKESVKINWSELF
jgi:hypothetical protein